MAKNRGNQESTEGQDLNLDEVQGEQFMAEQSDAQVANETVANENASSDQAAEAAVGGTTAVEAGEAKEFTADDGHAISRSAYIRQEFTKDRTRGDIAKELGVAYGIVYSATTNMENSHHSNNEDGTVNRGAVVTVQTADGEKKMSRAEYARQEVGNGRTRGDVAKELGVAYATVYAATKELEATAGAGAGTGRKLVEVEIDGEVKHLPRAQYIRSQFDLGKTRREIADELHCDYAVVWAATKGKTEGAELAQATTATDETIATEDTGLAVHTADENQPGDVAAE
jgi:transposase